MLPLPQWTVFLWNEQLQTEAVLLCADGIEQHFRRELVYPFQQVC